SYFDQAFLEIGDRLILTSWAYDEVNQSGTETLVNVTVAGVVKGLPGTGYGPQSLVFGSFETLEMLRPPAADPFRILNTRFLMALRPGEDWTAVKNAVLAMGATHVVVFQEQKVLELENPFQRAFIGFISMEIAFILVILTAGLGLILAAATLERDVEFAAITARGSSGWQTASLLVGEAFSIMLIGLLVGAGVGLGSAFATLSLISSLGSTGVVPLLFELSPQVFLLLAVAPATMLLAAALVSWRIARMNVARVLKLRGG
ncbi:MAG: ABC transporter permease, partial [Candidatus Thermoplasmatota archaeon]